MGKPSSSIVTKTSECSIQSSSSKHRNKGAMSAHKMEQLKKNNHKHVRRNINKLFNRLQRDSIGSRNKSRNTQSPSDCTPRNLTIVVENESFNPQLKRKSPDTVTSGPSKSRKKSNSLIVINDDDISKNNDSCILISPTINDSQNNHINCSTPIAKRDSQTLQNHIIENFPRTNISLNSRQSQNDIKEEDRTKVINKDSYLTIDLTAESENKTNTTVSVIDVDKNAHSINDSADCTVISVSTSSLSMSGDSDVTVLQNTRKSTNKHIKKLTSGLAQLNSSEKTNLLTLLAQNIFSGCKLKNVFQSGQVKTSSATETDEDAYIKEVILGESKTQGSAVSTSRNSIGSNIYHPSKDVKNSTGLRMIVIDGSNVAMEHTKGRMFSVEGLKICIDYFMRRGHVVKAFVPRFRCKFGKSSDPNLLDYLERQGVVVYTPSREIKGRSCVPYDDRYILQCAAEFDGVVVSGDNYRDLLKENDRWRYIIENRILPFTWVNNMIMFPKDPFGRGGPSLEMLLRHPTPSISRTENK